MFRDRVTTSLRLIGDWKKCWDCLNPLWLIGYKPLKQKSHRAYDYVPQNKTNRWHNQAIGLISRGWSEEQIWSQQARWSCSKLWTWDYKSQEVANRPCMIVRPVMQGRAINRAQSWADKSRDWSSDWLGHHAISSAIRETVSRPVHLVWSITISDDWLHDRKTGRATSGHLLVVLC